MDTLREEIEFLENKIIELEKKNEELHNVIKEMNWKQKQERHSIKRPQDSYSYYKPGPFLSTEPLLGGLQTPEVGTNAVINYAPYPWDRNDGF